MHFHRRRRPTRPFGVSEDLSPIAGAKSYALYRECAGQVELKWEIKPDRRRIPDTTPWTKPPYFGRTIALWGLYSAFNVDCPRWTGSGNGSITPQWYRRLRCVAIVLTKYRSEEH